MVKTINKFLCCSALGLLFGYDALAAEISTNTAQMQAMDKITGRVSVIDVPVNGNVKFGSFSILVRDCKTRSPEETPENFAFVDVVDDYDGNKPVNIFRGWMVSSSPALNAVEHPIYDVWLLKCVDKPVDKSKLLTAEQLAQRDALETVSASERVVDINPQVAETEQNKETAADLAKETVSEKELPEKSETVPEAPVPAAAEEQVAPATEVLPSVQPEEDGAPKSLLDFSTDQPQPEPTAAEDSADTAVPENESETVVEKVVLEETDAEVQPEGEAASPALPEKKQLIEFEEPVEEPLSFEAEALKKE